MQINVCKTKALTYVPSFFSPSPCASIPSSPSFLLLSHLDSNFRAAGKDDGTGVAPAIKMTLEETIAYCAADELIEITPKVIRLRKRGLEVAERKKAGHKSELGVLEGDQIPIEE